MIQTSVTKIFGYKSLLHARCYK